LVYERDERLHVHWSLPRKYIRNGLVLIENQANIKQMVNACKKGKTMDLFFDHTNFLLGLREDVIVRIPLIGKRTAPRLPSPDEITEAPNQDDCMAAPPPRAEACSSSSFFIAHNEEIESMHSDESDSLDNEFHDSDFNAKSGDDDLLQIIFTSM
jgi:hypothetical protein